MKTRSDTRTRGGGRGAQRSWGAADNMWEGGAGWQRGPGWNGISHGHSWVSAEAIEEGGKAELQKQGVTSDGSVSRGMWP